MTILNIALMLAAVTICLTLCVRADLERTKSELLALALRLIGEAEKLDLPGPDKMRHVVHLLTLQVPILLAKILTPDVLEDMAQKAFDEMKIFATLRAQR